MCSVMFVDVHEYFKVSIITQGALGGAWEGLKWYVHVNSFEVLTDL